MALGPCLVLKDILLLDDNIEKSEGLITPGPHLLDEPWFRAKLIFVYKVYAPVDHGSALVGFICSY